MKGKNIARHMICFIVALSLLGGSEGARAELSAPDSAVPTTTQVPDTGQMNEKIAQLLSDTPVGETIATNTDANATKLSVIEAYEAATGEKCRRYALFGDKNEQGMIRTACRSDESLQWFILRPMSHETLSPLAAHPVSAKQENK